MKKGRRGFTVIELLVVITVIALLAALIFPTLAGAKRRSRAASCQANLRQIYAAFELYLQDYDESYPNTGDPFLWMGRKWRWVLQDHLRFSAQMMPGDPLKSRGNKPGPLLCPDDTAAPTQWDGTSYSYSMCFYHSPDQINAMTTIAQTWTDRPECVTCRKGEVDYPSQKVLLTEWLSNHEKPHVGFGSWEGARNYLFADGHCLYLAAKRIKPANDGWPDINLTVDGIAGKDID